MKKNSPLNILVVRFSALGDVAMTIPAIYSVAESYPMHRFHVVTSAFCAQLFIGAPSNVVMHPLEQVKLRQIFRCVKPLGIDRVADLHNVNRAWCVDAYYRLHGKQVAMLDKRRWERGAVRKAHYTTPVSFTERYFHVFKRLGLPAKFFFEQLPASALPSLPSELPAKGGKRWVGIAPFARYDNKTYPLEKMRQVVELLSQQENVEVFLFGGRKEAQILEQWCESSTTVHSVAGRFKMAEELALMSQLEVMVSMDSSNMHLASLVGTRVLSIWGSTSPACGFMGWRQNKCDAILSGCACQPCTIAGSNHCKHQDLRCLNEISPDLIVEKIKEVLDNSQK